MKNNITFLANKISNSIANDIIFSGTNNAKYTIPS